MSERADGGTHDALRVGVVIEQGDPPVVYLMPQPDDEVGGPGPYGRIGPLPPEMTDQQIADTYGVDVVRRATPLKRVAVLFLDGPRQGETDTFPFNLLGSRLSERRPAPGGGVRFDYELVALAHGEHPAHMRLVPPDPAA